MNFNSRVAKLTVVALVCVGSLSACSAQGSKWPALYAAGLKASNSGDLDGAAQNYRAAIAEAEKHSVPDKLYYGAIVGLGNTLLQQKKDGEAISYLVRALQLGNATNMSLEENVDILHKLAHAEAKTRDWDEAVGTEKSLITLLNVEKGPLTPQLKEEREFNDLITAKQTAYRLEHSTLSADPAQKTQ